MGRFLVLALAFGSAALLGVWVAPAVAQSAPPRASFALQPMGTRNPYFVFNADPGAAVHGVLTVRNVGPVQGTALLYPVDAATGQTSGVVYRSAQEPRRDAGAWITLGLSQVILSPGQHQEVSFTVSVPPAARPGQHVAGIVAENTALGAASPSSKEGPSAQVRIRNLTIMAVQVNLPGPVIHRLAVGGVTASGSGEGHQSLLVGLSNEGTVMERPTGRLVVQDSSGARVQDIPLALDTLLPRSTIAYPVFVRGQALSVGAYRASLTLRYDGRTTRAVRDFTISAAQRKQVFREQPPVRAGRTPGSGLPVPLMIGVGLGLVLLGVLGGLAIANRRRIRAQLGPPAAEEAPQK